MTAPRTRVQRRPVHGVLLLDKPLGLSSNNALQRCKWLLRAEKAGHTGTLDPLATGVLPLCFGAATKFSQLQLDADKTYEATIRLGQKTSTGDAEGDVIETREVPRLTADDIAAVATRFTGPQRQMPPMYSALKKDGKALYEYARAGEDVEREPRDIVVRELHLTPDGKTDLRMVARVTKGTYIRTLGEDIGEALGCGGHLVSLRRIATGQFDVSQCVTLDAFESMTDEARSQALLPVESLLVDHTRVTLDADNAGRFLSGLRRRGTWLDTEQVAVFGPLPSSQPSPKEGRSEALLGTAHVKGGELIPGRLLSPPEVAQIQESNP
ncbi:tRNA pseudouridine(55) synthase TruB [Caenimonas sp. SL110]|uniref:tRNA pseudouridine(55) synthase TruB n=1 Tax=Caenimonas sp. SL110 TaxID=1450524 RepID=UPI000653345A|nr:tRNA pseudouridine(55) synthase TruB [Caenimonas sp. SL110]